MLVISMCQENTINTIDKLNDKICEWTYVPDYIQKSADIADSLFY